MAPRALDTALTVTVGLVSAAAIGTTAVGIHLAGDHATDLASSTSQQPDVRQQTRTAGSDDDTTGPGEQTGVGTLPGASATTTAPTHRRPSSRGFTQVTPPQSGGGGGSHSGSGGS